MFFLEDNFYGNVFLTFKKKKFTVFSIDLLLTDTWFVILSHIKKFLILKFLDFLKKVYKQIILLKN